MSTVLLGSFLSAMSTGLGAFIILFISQSITHHFRDLILAFTAGVMMAACMMGLIPEALSQGGFIPLCIGIYFGVIALTTLEKNIPHIDLNHSASSIQFDHKAMLIISAITLHNIPEGLSVGVSYASSIEETGNLIAFAIGLQNAPEGFLIALFLVKQEINKFKAFFIATLTGSIEVVAAIIGYLLTAYVQNLIPFGLAFAAGAMLYVVVEELIPEMSEGEHSNIGTIFFAVGFSLMMVLDVALG